MLKRKLILLSFVFSMLSGCTLTPDQSVSLTSTNSALLAPQANISGKQNAILVVSPNGIEAARKLENEVSALLPFSVNSFTDKAYLTGFDKELVANIKSRNDNLILIVAGAANESKNLGTDCYGDGMGGVSCYDVTDNSSTAHINVKVGSKDEMTYMGKFSFFDKQEHRTYTMSLAEYIANTIVLDMEKKGVFDGSFAVNPDTLTIEVGEEPKYTK
ncbi:hypothetical protein [Vibrio paucivorans]